MVFVSFGLDSRYNHERGALSRKNRVRFGESCLSRRQPISPLRDTAQRASLSSVNDRDLIERLDALKLEHRDLDEAIAALAEAGIPDQLRMARLKKRKLRLRDEISTLESRLIPDIIA